MHLSLHKKAYRDILLIANGHEVYKNDLSKFVQNIHHIDIYSDDEHHLNSLDSFKSYIKNIGFLSTFRAKKLKISPQGYFCTPRLI